MAQSTPPMPAALQRDIARIVLKGPRSRSPRRSSLLLPLAFAGIVLMAGCNRKALNRATLPEALPPSEGPCSLTRPGAGETGADPAPTYLVTGQGVCRLHPDDSRLFASLDASTPRRLGLPYLTTLREGDTLILSPLDPTPASWQAQPMDPSDPHLERPLEVDPRFEHMRADVPKNSTPLRQLGATTQGILEALGEFDHEDHRPADGPETLRVLIRAGKPGRVKLELVQHYSRDLRRGASAEEGIDRRLLEVRVLPADQPIATGYGERALERSPLELGEGDLLALPVSLGYMNRGGIETRGPVGVRIMALEPTQQ